MLQVGTADILQLYNGVHEMGRWLLDRPIIMKQRSCAVYTDAIHLKNLFSKYC